MKRHASSRTMRRPWLRFGIGLFPILLSACAAREVRVVCQMALPPAPLMAPPPAESFRSKLQAILDSAYSTSSIKPTAKH